MKLIIISPFPPYRGGIAKETEILYNNLIINNRLSVINFQRLYPSIFFPGKSQYRENKQTYNYKNVYNLLDSINPFTWEKVSKFILKSKTKNVVLRYWHPFFIPSYLYIILRVKYINKNISFYSICDNIFPHESYPFTKIVSKYFFKKIDYFFVMSDNNYDLLSTFVNNQKIKKIFLPVENYFGPTLNQKDAQKLLKIEDNKFTMLFFGLIRKYKGLDLLITSLKMIKSHIDDFKLIIAGESYVDEKYYKHLISKYNLDNNIIWINDYIPDDEVNKYFSACDLVVLPYQTASQSGIIPIAYQYNKLVLGSNIKGIEEFIVEGKTGYFFEANNSKSLAEQILFIKQKHNFDLSNKYIPNYKKKYETSKVIHEIIDFIK